MIVEYIKYFNKSIVKLKKLYPENEVIIWLDRLIENGVYGDYYQAMDSIGFSLGIQFRIQEIETANGKDAWVPFIYYNEKNVLRRPLVHNPSSLTNYYSSLNKAYAYVAKQHLYALMEINNLEQVLANRHF